MQLTNEKIFFEKKFLHKKYIIFFINLIFFERK